MSSGIVDQITLECLMNKELYYKLVTNKKNAQDKITDTKLYRKRIIALTKELLMNVPQTDLMQDVEYAFNNYVKTCLRHFKITDDIHSGAGASAGASALETPSCKVDESECDLLHFGGRLATGKVEEVEEVEESECDLLHFGGRLATGKVEDLLHFGGGCSEAPTGKVDGKVDDKVEFKTILFPSGTLDGFLNYKGCLTEG
jgi:hypothetical protein